jgi:hypothetical protein
MYSDLACGAMVVRRMLIHSMLVGLGMKFFEALSSSASFWSVKAMRTEAPSGLLSTVAVSPVSSRVFPSGVLSTKLVHDAP